MPGIGQSAIVAVNHGNNVFQKTLHKTIGPPLRRPGGTFFSGTTKIPGAIVHYNNKRLGLALGQEIVHNQVNMALVRPACFILATSMLQIQNRISLLGMLVVAGWGVNKATSHGLAGFRVI